MAKKGIRYIENDDCTVTVYNVKIPGFVAHDKRCPDCDRITIYAERHDAYCCPICDAWLEPACSDPTCHFCAERPAPLLSGDPTDSAQDAQNARRRARSQRRGERVFHKAHRTRKKR